jgi:hypothetical protein
MGKIYTIRRHKIKFSLEFNIYNKKIYNRGKNIFKQHKYKIFILNVLLIIRKNIYNRLKNIYNKNKI